MQSVDLVIVGGGMVGLALALGVKQSGLQVAVIDPHPPTALSESPQLRVSAINLASQTLLERLGAWQAIEQKAPYHAMQVWEQDSFAKIDFDTQDAGQPVLGHIIENARIRHALWQQAVQAPHIQLLETSLDKLHMGKQEAFVTLKNGEMLTTRLVVGADGANSQIRALADFPLTFWDYEHTAIVATVRCAEPHQATARQVFTPNGPLAFLPLRDPHLCSIVWSQDNPRAQDLLAMSAEDFNHALTAAFNSTLGVCEVEGDKASFPLKMRYARQWVSDRIAIIGDAAHTIHPLAGQGVNLGFLDAAALAETLNQLVAEDKDIGVGKHLRHFERWRKAEAMQMCAAMEGFKRLFQGTNPLQKLIRGAGMRIVNSVPFAKHKAIRQAMGLDGELPQMVKANH